MNNNISPVWYLYIVQCNDEGKTLYTGITNNLDKRIAKHNAGTGAKYTKGRGPVQLIYSEKFANKSEAAKREYAVKQLSRLEKIAVINRGNGTSSCKN